MTTIARRRPGGQIGLAVVGVVVGALLLAGCSSARQLGPLPPPPHDSSTLFGSTVQVHPGESFAVARVRLNGTFGRLPIIRYYDSGPPDPWHTIRHNVGHSPVVISFKLPPTALISGSYDHQMRSWFAAAPTGVPTYWSYQPEPEDEIAAGDFTAAEFRAAWRHLDDLATSVHNPALKSTLVLMCYTLSPTSGRSWQHYYPGARYVDVAGWDCYNRLAIQGKYGSPSSIFSPAIDVSRQLHKPFAIAETGSLLVADDSGSGRARWLLEMADFLSSQGAVFVTYFNSDVGGDYRLLDAASQHAWRQVVSG
ncbi:MAG: hypothetical protein ACRDPG_05880 [Nocardioidaceae bacterium]